MLPEVVKVEREWRARLADREAVAMGKLGQRYAQMTNRLMVHFESLAEQVTRMAEAGEAVSVGKLYQLERWQRMAAAIDREFALYAPFASDLIEAEQQHLLSAGADAAVDTLGAIGRSSGIPDALGVEHAVGIIEGMPKEAYAQLVGQTEGGPLLSLLNEATAGTGGDIGQVLTQGVGLGKNPTVVAREMADAFGVPLARAQCIARTEMLSAFRATSQDSYRRVGLTQYERLSAQDSRVCPGCIAAEGTLYPVEVAFQDHPNCRCTLLPYWPGIGGNWPTGEEWFKQQDEGLQRSLLGNTRFDMWKSGEVPFRNFATVVSNDTWGGAVVATSISDLRMGLGGNVGGVPAPKLPTGLRGTTTANAFTPLPEAPKPPVAPDAWEVPGTDFGMTDWEDLTSYDELNAYVQGLLTPTREGIVPTVDLSGVNLGQANSIAHAVRDEQRATGRVVLNRIDGSEHRPNVYASASSQRQFGSRMGMQYNPDTLVTGRAMQEDRPPRWLDDLLAFDTQQVPGSVVSKPFNAFEFASDAEEKRRMLWSHELGHHRYFELDDASRQSSRAFTGFEDDIEDMFSDMIGGGGRERGVCLSEYGYHNAKEWWAEAFSMWRHGMGDYIDPRLRAIMEWCIRDGKPYQPGEIFGDW